MAYTSRRINTQTRCI